MVARVVAKTHLSAKSLIGKARDIFKKAKKPKKGGQGQSKEISLVDCLSSALAIFKLKFPSLLQFEDALIDEDIKQNIKNLLDLENVPSDTYIRERLDPRILLILKSVNPPLFKRIYFFFVCVVKVDLNANRLAHTMQSADLLLPRSSLLGTTRNFYRTHLKK